MVAGGRVERAQAVLNALFAVAPDALVVVDRRAQIAGINAHAERLFGYADAEVAGLPIDLLLPGAVDEVSRHVGRDLASSGVTPMDWGQSARRKDGSTVPVELSISTVDDGHGRQMVVAAVHERWTSVDQSHRFETLGRLSGGVVHDFNNMLSVILNYTAFVVDRLGQDDLQAVDIEESRHDLGQVIAAADRAAVLARELLAFGRRRAADPEIVDLNDIVRGVEGLLRATFGQQVQIEEALSVEPLWIEVDPAEIEQVLVDLALTARDAIPDGGLLRIKTDLVDAGETPLTLGTAVPSDRYARLRLTGASAGPLDPAGRESASTGPSGMQELVDMPARVIAGAGGGVWRDVAAGGGTSVILLLPVPGEGGPSGG